MLDICFLQTIDMLDSASTYNAKVAARDNATKTNGYFSHTATVPRYGTRRPPPDSEEYITSESYESDYHSDHRRPPPSAPRLDLCFTIHIGWCNFSTLSMLGISSEQWIQFATVTYIGSCFLLSNYMTNPVDILFPSWTPCLRDFHFVGDFRYHEESGMTIILDAQPTRGMEVENVEYEVNNVSSISSTQLCYWTHTILYYDLVTGNPHKS